MGWNMHVIKPCLVSERANSKYCSNNKTVGLPLFPLLLFLLFLLSSCYALNWFPVPKTIQELMFDYYEKLCAMIITNNWSTGFFLFDIGLFQGCVLSTILFTYVFQLLLDFLRPRECLGYEFKSSPTVQTFKQAYAVDLTLITTNSNDMQLAVNETNIWWEWSQTMKAKPKNCIAVGFKLFENPYH